MLNRKCMYLLFHSLKTQESSSFIIAATGTGNLINCKKVDRAMHATYSEFTALFEL